LTLAENKKPLHFVQLDALRFLAAFMVVFSHAFDGWFGYYGIPKLFRDASGEWNTLGDHLHRFTANMNFGVDMFFLISGFLITYLLLREKNDKGKINIPAFFARRALRIWPLYFFVIAVSPFLVSWLNFAEPEYKPVLFFYNNFRTMATHQWDFPFAHFWSICIEEHFYLVWPFLVALVPIKRLPWFLAAIILTSIGYRAYAWYNTEVWFHAYMHTLARIDVLAIGGLAAWAHFRWPYKLKMPVWLRLILFGALVSLFFFDHINDWPSLFMLCAKKYLYVLLAGILMMHYVFSPDAFFKWGPKHPINYLGRCCFGIYLWGNILLPIIILKFLQPLYGANGRALIYWPAVIIISLVVPVISYELIERPFLKLKSRFAVIKTRV
jgi:peptidoglycan/LPS O-acetylase OafA/YrhL